MHYQISEHIIVKSENAALTTKQPNKNILNYISHLSGNIAVLDYGCGKLRHSIYLYQKSVILTVVDSDIQLTRIQMINNVKTSVLNYLQLYMPSVNVYTLDSDEWKNRKYDFILNSNVLSAIPSMVERKNVLKNISRILNPDGKCLITLQYRNSYFNTYKNNPNAIPFLDGWLIKKDNNYSFYGIIEPNELVMLCVNNGLEVLNKKCIDGSIYLEVKRSSHFSNK